MVQFDGDVRMGSPSSLPYDPDQDAAEKRDIRKKYRALEKRTGGPWRRYFYMSQELIIMLSVHQNNFAHKTSGPLNSWNKL